MTQDNESGFLDDGNRGKIVDVPTFRVKKDAECWMESAFPGLQCDFQKCALAILNPKIRRFVALAQEFPLVAKSVECIVFKVFPTTRSDLARGRRYHQVMRELLENGDVEGASLSGDMADKLLRNYGSLGYVNRNDTCIRFNARHYGSEKHYHKRLLHEETIHWNAFTNCAYDSILTHEFAHLITFWIIRCGENVQIGNSQGKAGTLYPEWIRQHNLNEEISLLASQNHLELIAEAFVSYYHGAQPSVTAVEIVNVTKDVFRQIDEARAQ